MSVLLPALVLLVATTAVLLAARVWKARKRPGGSRRGRAAPGAAGSPPAEEPPGSPPYIPCGCGPGCGPCAAAARELRGLVGPLWPGGSFPRDSEMWRLLWEDLEQLLERGRLPCCASSSSSSSSGSPRPPRSQRTTRALIHRRTSAAGKGSVLRRTRRWWRSSALPRMSIPRKGSSIPAQTVSDLCCAPAGAWPVPVMKQVQVSWSRRCPIHSSPDPAVEPSGKTLRTLLDKRLQRQRQLFPACAACSLEPAGKDKAKEDLHSLDIYSQGLRSCQSLHEICWTPDGGAHRDRPPCLGAVAIHRTHQIPTARKSLGTQLGARAIPAKRSQEQVAQQEVSWSRRCPMHGPQDAAAVPQDKTLRAVLDKRLQRERGQLLFQGALGRWGQPLFQGALGRWLPRLRMRLVAAAGTVRGFLCAE